MAEPEQQRRYGGPNGYGHIDDPEGHARTNVRVMFARLGIDHEAAAEVTEASNRQFGPGVLNQSRSSACTGHAVSGASYTTLGAAGTPLEAPLSQDWIYKIGRALDRHLNPDGSRPPLTDTGAQPNQVMRGLTEFGAPLMGPRPPDGSFTDCDPATINDEPTLGAVEVAADIELEGQYEIFPWDPQFIALIRAALVSRLCICFRIFVDVDGPRSVEGWDPTTGPLGAVATPGDPKGGYHYVYCDGFHTAADGSTIIDWVNSWGEGWGKAGYGEGNEAFIRGWANVVVMKIRRKTPALAAA